MPWRVPSQIPLPPNFVGFEPKSSIPQTGFSSYERHMPHWRVDGGCYFVTIRLNDSIPKEVEQEMRREKESWQQRLRQAMAQHEGRLPEHEARAWEEFQRSRLRKLESLLDQGEGSCVFRDPDFRGLVEKAFHHFEGTRCEMLAFVVMPNHAHLVCRPEAGHTLEDLCHSWKWFTGQEIQRRQDDHGQLWQHENFDRIIRDADHFSRAVRYIAQNPIKAQLAEREATVWFSPAIRQANGWT